MKELFEKVYIKSDADLPAHEKDNYSVIVFVGRENKLLGRARYTHDTGEWFDDNFAILDVEWYLRPVEQAPARSAEEIYKEAMIEWENDAKTNPNAINPIPFCYGYKVAYRKFASQTRELPSDEEIYLAAEEYLTFHDGSDTDFIAGANWLKSKLQ